MRLPKLIKPLKMPIDPDYSFVDAALPCAGSVGQIPVRDERGFRHDQSLQARRRQRAGRPGWKSGLHSVQNALEPFPFRLNRNGALDSLF